MKSKKILKIGLTLICCSTLLIGCGQSAESTVTQENVTEEAQPGIKTETEEETYADVTQILLSDAGVTVDGKDAATEDTGAVYVAHDIIYYEDGKDFTYGEGTEADAHTKEEAEEHTVVHITEPGSYHISGTLSAGQIAVDLGEDAEENPEAVVTLILDNADISCSVAPAVIFYEVYECGTVDEESATKDVDTATAGANVIIADGSVNNISGSYVAKIYKSYELSEDGTEVVDSKKLHKYDGAFYSKMSMNIDGGKEGTGILNITAENEGLDSELHLTVNGGNINITSGNDGINTNEDGVSVTTINGGNLNIVVDGATGEGDGIDSNGWLVINGGTVTAAACASSADAGIDSDMGIHINGGTVVATGNMLDEISESTQNYIVLSFSSGQEGGTSYSIKDEAGGTVVESTPANDFTYFIFSSESLIEGTYSIWMDDSQLSGMASESGMAGPGRGGVPHGGEMPEGMERPEGGEMPEGMERSEEGEKPEGMERSEEGETPERMERPEGEKKPERMEVPEGAELPEGIEIPEAGEMHALEESSIDFVVSTGGNYYSNVGIADQE